MTNSTSRTTQRIGALHIGALHTGALRLAALLLLAVPHAGAEENPIETGLVEWSHDLDAALAASAETGRPVFLLFQEVPGCDGVKAYGLDVLSNPLLVEAIEDEFLPVLAYNNRFTDADRALLERFDEPTWNYQVVRYLDANGSDILPRKERVWSQTDTAARMIAVLRAAERPVPKYLELVAAETDTKRHATAAFAMYCFWTGEREIGKLDGVIQTEAGWFEGKEVTRVTYDPSRLSLQDLSAKAAAARCNSKVYAPDDDLELLTKFASSALTDEYRVAKASDQKKQLEQWTAVRALPNLTPMQLTKVNAFAPDSRAAALEWLSPRQRAALEVEASASSR